MWPNCVCICFLISIYYSIESIFVAHFPSILANNNIFCVCLWFVFILLAYTTRFSYRDMVKSCKHDILKRLCNGPKWIFHFGRHRGAFGKGIDSRSFFRGVLRCFYSLELTRKYVTSDISIQSHQCDVHQWWANYMCFRESKGKFRLIQMTIDMVNCEKQNNIAIIDICSINHL